MTRIKICGITTIDDALVAIELGAHALGFVFAESPRRITPPTAREIIRCLPPFAAAVGVFVNEQPAVIKQIFHDCNLSAVQLHGDEDYQYIRQLSLPVIKAFRVRDIHILAVIKSFHLPHFLLDAFDAQARGGTGKVCDWRIAQQAAEYGKVILSGGLDHHNVGEALQAVQPYAVDVNSGVEKQPGLKDHTKLGQFIDEVHKWDNRTNAVTSENTAAASFLKH